MRKKRVLLCIITVLLVACDPPQIEVLQKSVKLELKAPDGVCFATDTIRFIAKCATATRQRLQCVLNADSYFVLTEVSAQSSDSVVLTVFKPDSLPDYEWHRDTAMRIIGNVVYSVISNDTVSRRDTTIFVPFRPNKPRFNIDIVGVDSAQMTANLAWRANGASNYLLTYSQDGVLHQEWFNSKIETFTIVNIDINELYYFKLTAFNNYGAIDSEQIRIGNYKTELSMYVVHIGNTITYNFKLGSNQVSDLSVKKVTVYNAVTAIAEMENIQAKIGEIIDVSALSSGYYILKVELEDGRIFSARFFKR